MRKFVERDVEDEEWFIKKWKKVERRENVEEGRAGNQWQERYSW